MKCLSILNSNGICQTTITKKHPIHCGLDYQGVFMQQNLYDQLCEWDDTSGTLCTVTLSQVLSLYTGMMDVDSILCYIKIHHDEWEKIAKRSGLTFDELIDIFTDIMIYQDDPKIEFQIIRYCGDNGTLTTLIEISNCKILNQDASNSKNYNIYKRGNIYIELDWHVGSLVT